MAKKGPVEELCKDCVHFSICDKKEAPKELGKKAWGDFFHIGCFFPGGPSYAVFNSWRKEDGMGS